MNYDKIYLNYTNNAGKKRERRFSKRFDYNFPRIIALSKAPKITQQEESFLLE